MCGLGAIVLLCACLYLPLPVAFAGLDAVPLTTVADAASGNSSALMDALSGHGNYAEFGYRPLFYCALFLEHALFSGWFTGYHIVNIILLAASCWLLSLIVVEVTGKYGNRLGACPAIWAGLLLAVYPVNSALTSSLSGLQPLLGSFFGFFALFSFLRYRLLLERSYYLLSICSFFLALLSWESAAVLPLVITLTFLLPEQEVKGNTPGRMVELTAPFWAILALYSASRPEWLQAAMQNVAQLPFDINKVVLTFWELVLYGPEDQLAFPQMKALGLILVVLFLRLVAAQGSYRGPLFLILWAFTYLLQPNGAWSLGFIAPLCATIVVTFLPAVDRMGKAAAALYATAGCQLLIVLLCYWAFKMMF